MASNADGSTTEGKVISIISEQLNVDKSKVSRSTDIANDLGADSLDIAELMIALEESFDINIDEESIQNVTTVGEVIDHIDHALGTSNAKKQDSMSDGEENDATDKPLK